MQDKNVLEYVERQKNFMSRIKKVSLKKTELLCCHVGMPIVFTLLFLFFLFFGYCA